MILEDVLTWTRWLADTRVSVEPSGISESTKVAPLLYRRSMPLSRSIRPMLSRLHLHVLPILDMVHIPVAFSETSEIRSREEVAAMAPPDGLSQGSGPFTRHVGLTCSNSESLAARATVKPWRRPFDSAFKRLSDTTVSLRYSSRVNKARRAHPETGRISVCNPSSGFQISASVDNSIS